MSCRRWHQSLQLNFGEGEHRAEDLAVRLQVEVIGRRDFRRREDCPVAHRWSPINQLKRALKNKIARAQLSLRVLADAVNTSPSQVVWLLEEDRGSKQFLRLSKLAQIAGYDIEIKLNKRTAA